MERREAGQLRRVFEVFQDVRLFVVGRLCRLQGGVKLLLLPFEFFPQFGFLTPLLFNRLVTFLQHPVQRFPFSDTDPIPDEGDDSRDQNRHSEEGL